MSIKSLKVITLKLGDKVFKGDVLRQGNTGRALIHMLGVLIRRNEDIDTSGGDKCV